MASANALTGSLTAALDAWLDGDVPAGSGRGDAAGSDATVSAGPTSVSPGGAVTAPSGNVGPGDWAPLLRHWRDGLAGQTLLAAVDARVAAGAIVYPAAVFRALAVTPRTDVKVVIVGQDPYHGPGQADGLAFSVPDGTPWPPSLRNVWTEVARDVGVPLPPRGHGSLASWARQGVLLLNTALTVEADRPASHATLGWQALTDAIGESVWRSSLPTVFLLWGGHAQKRAETWMAGTAAGAPHTVLRSNHPSPLAARRPPVPFVGCGHFGAADRALVAHGREPIRWLPDRSGCVI